MRPTLTLVMEPDFPGLAHEWNRSRLRRRAITQSTAAKNGHSLRAFAKWWGPRPVAKLTRRHVDAWLGDQLETCAPSTVRGRFTTLRMFCAWLVDEGHLAANPCDGVDPPKVRFTQPRAITDVQIRAVLAVCPDPRARAVVWSMVGLGFRACEVSRLQVEDWDVTAGLVSVAGKGGRQRWLPVPTVVAGAWDLYLAEWPAAQGPMFRSYRQPWRSLSADTVSHMVSGWMADAGVRRRRHDGLSGHGLRHTFAQRLADQSGDIRDVQEALGHASLATTTVYMRRHRAARLAEVMEAAVDFAPDAA